MGDITDPHLVRLGDLQIGNQIGITPEAMFAVCCVLLLVLVGAQKSHITHQPLNALAIDYNAIRIPSQLLGDSPTSVGRKSCGDFFHRFLQHCLLPLNRLVVVAAERKLQQAAQAADRIAFLFVKHGYGFPLLLSAYCK
jgi:hypothetical protein